MPSSWAVQKGLDVAPGHGLGSPALGHEMCVCPLTCYGLLGRLLSPRLFPWAQGGGKTPTLVPSPCYRSSVADWTMLTHTTERHMLATE